MREISADADYRNQSGSSTQCGSTQCGSTAPALPEDDAAVPPTADESRLRRPVSLASVAPLLLAAQEDAAGGQFDIMSELAHPLLLAVVFTLIGLALFAASLWLIVRIAPFSIRKEIEEDQNTSLGIIIGSIILGIAMILSAAMLG